MRPALRLTLALAIGLPVAAAAQEVRIRVVNQATKAPLVGALVSLKNTEDVVVTRALTDERGRAVLTAPAAGSYRVRTDGIGYAGRLSAPITLEVGGSASLEVALELSVFKLNEVVVSASRAVVCRSRSDAAAVARIWDEAGKALTATALTLSNRSLLFEIRTIGRRLSPTGRLVAESVSTKRGPAERPFRAADPELLHQRGYVHQEEDGSATYFGPDAELLLSDRFLDDHCFGLAENGPADKVGLTFEPVRSRLVPDIRGTLWLDRATLELDHLTFSYTGVDLPEEATGVGGRVALAKLPNGGWIVQRWHIRMPVVAKVLGNLARKDQLRGYREAAGEAILAGTTATFATATAIFGTVFDSTLGTPLEGALASIQAGDFVATSDRDGHYLIEPPSVGPYLITIRHPRLQTLGLDSLTASATVVKGATDTVAISVPSRATLVNQFCEPSGDHAITGRVRDAATTKPLAAIVAIRFADATIRARPKPRRGSPPSVAVGERGTTAETETNPSGIFRVCGIPPGIAAEAIVRVPGRNPFSVPIPADEGPFVVLDLLIP